MSRSSGLFYHCALVGESVVCFQKVGVEQTLWIVDAELLALQEGLNVSDDV